MVRVCRICVNGLEKKKEIYELVNFFDFPFRDDLKLFIDAFPPDFKNDLRDFKKSFIPKAKELIYYYAHKTRHLIDDSPKNWEKWLQGIPLLPVHIEEVLDKMYLIKRSNEERQERILGLLKGWLAVSEKDRPQSLVPDARKWMVR